VAKEFLLIRGFSILCALFNKSVRKNKKITGRMAVLTRFVQLKLSKNVIIKGSSLLQIFKLTADGPSVMYVKHLEERLERIETKQINR
jgi:hypothetical protein